MSGPLLVVLIAGLGLVLVPGLPSGRPPSVVNIVFHITVRSLATTAVVSNTTNVAPRLLRVVLITGLNPPP